MRKPVLLAIALAAIVPSRVLAADAVHMATSALFDTLSSSDDARDRALAASMTAPQNDDDRSRRRSAFIFASAGAPKDALVQWLAANSVGGCTHAPEDAAALNMFRSLEPRNAAADLLDLDRASACGDAAAESAALEKMAQAGKFDPHFGTAMQAWLTVLQREPDGNALIAARAAANPQNAGPIKVASDFAFAATEPDFGPLRNACAKRTDASRLALCARIGHILAYQSLSALDRSVGFELLEHTGASSANDRQALREMHWLLTPPLDSKSRNLVSRAIATGWRENDDELMIMRQAFIAAGLPTSPPPGWVDPTPMR